VFYLKEYIKDEENKCIKLNKWIDLNDQNGSFCDVAEFHSKVSVLNISTPLALFVLMLPKAKLTSHSRMSDSR